MKFLYILINSIVLLALVAASAYFWVLVCMISSKYVGADWLIVWLIAILSIASGVALFFALPQGPES